MEGRVAAVAERYGWADPAIRARIMAQVEKLQAGGEMGPKIGALLPLVNGLFPARRKAPIVAPEAPQSNFAGNAKVPPLSPRPEPLELISSHASLQRSLSESEDSGTAQKSSPSPQSAATTAGAKGNLRRNRIESSESESEEMMESQKPIPVSRRVIDSSDSEDEAPNGDSSIGQFSPQPFPATMDGQSPELAAGTPLSDGRDLAASSTDGRSGSDGSPVNVPTPDYSVESSPADISPVLSVKLSLPRSAPRSRKYLVSSDSDSNGDHQEVEPPSESLDRAVSGSTGPEHVPSSPANDDVDTTKSIPFRLVPYSSDSESSDDTSATTGRGQEHVADLASPKRAISSEVNGASATEVSEEVVDALGRMTLGEKEEAAPTPSPSFVPSLTRAFARILLSSSEGEAENEEPAAAAAATPSLADEHTRPQEETAVASPWQCPVIDDPIDVGTSPQKITGPAVVPPSTARRRRLNRKARESSSDSSGSDDEGADPASNPRPQRRSHRGTSQRTRSAIETIVIDDSDDSAEEVPALWRSDEDSGDDSFIVATSEEEDGGGLDEPQNRDDSPDLGTPSPGIRRSVSPQQSSPETPPSTEPKTPARARATPSQTPGKTPAQLRTAFSRKRERLAQEYYTEFNKRAFGGVLPKVGQPGETGPDVVPIAWSKTLNTTAGTTRLIRSHNVYSAEIALSTKVVDEDSRLRNTLCHEMCHAAAFLQDKVVKPPHGAAFKKWAAKAMAVYPELSIATCHSYEINFKFKWQCQTCMKEYGRHSNSIDTTKQRCGSCTGVLKLLPRLRADGTPAKARQPSKWLLYCQQHIGRLKRENPHMSHADVMALLSQQYRASGAN